MKKLFLLVAVIFATFSASAQFYYGGALGFTRNATDKSQLLQLPLKLATLSMKNGHWVVCSITIIIITKV